MKKSHHHRRDTKLGVLIGHDRLQEVGASSSTLKTIAEQHFTTPAMRSLVANALKLDENILPSDMSHKESIVPILDLKSRSDTKAQTAPELVTDIEKTIENNIKKEVIVDWEEELDVSAFDSVLDKNDNDLVQSLDPSVMHLASVRKLNGKKQKEHTDINVQRGFISAADFHVNLLSKPKINEVLRKQEKSSTISKQKKKNISCAEDEKSSSRGSKSMEDIDAVPILHQQSLVIGRMYFNPDAQRWERVKIGKSLNDSSSAADAFSDYNSSEEEWMKAFETASTDDEEDGGLASMIKRKIDTEKERRTVLTRMGTAEKRLIRRCERDHTLQFTASLLLNLRQWRRAKKRRRKEFLKFDGDQPEKIVNMERTKIISEQLLKERQNSSKLAKAMTL